MLGHLTFYQLVLMLIIFFIKKTGNSDYHDNILYLDCERVEIRMLFNLSNYEEIKIELEIKGFDSAKYTA